MFKKKKKNLPVCCFCRYHTNRVYDLRSPVGLSSCFADQMTGNHSFESLCKSDADDLTTNGTFSSEESEETDSNSSRSGTEPLSSLLKSERSTRDDNENDPTFMLADSPPLITRRTR